MKNFLTTYFLTAFVLLLMGGCSDNYSEYNNLNPSLSAHYLGVSKDNFVFSQFSGTENFKVDSYNTSWNFSGTSDWFSLTPRSGSISADVSLEVEENTDANNARTSIFYLQSTGGWDYNHAMSVSQDKAEAYLEVEEKRLDFGGAASSRTIDVSANCDWTTECSASWVTMTADVIAGRLTVTVEPNPDSSRRSTASYLNYGNSQFITIWIYQDPSEITTPDVNLEFENSASRYTITINSEAPWTATPSDNWVTVEPESGKAGSTDVSIEVTPNPSVSERFTSVVFSTGSTRKLWVYITQKGLFIDVEPSSLTFGSGVESQTFNISSNTEWTITSKPNWIELSKESGEGNSTVTLTTEDNPNTSSRSGVITVSHPGLSLQKNVSITQKGKSLEPDVTLLEFTDKAGELQFNLESDTPWTSTVSADWFKASPLSGNGNAVITVTVDENTSSEERIGTIEYNYSDKTTNVNVHQLAKYMTVDNDTFEFDAQGGSHTIEVLTNDEWTAQLEHEVDWLHLSESTGNGEAVITITADDNPSVNPRSTTLLIESKYSQSVRILISQKPRHLSVSAESILFFAKGGTSEPVTIETNGTYEITMEGSWFTVNRDSSSSFTVYAPANTSNNVRTGKIIISLTDLKEGSLSLEMPVMQAGVGGSFILNGFTEDRDWNAVDKGGMTVTVKGYTSDQNWNDNNSASLTVTVSGYSSDNDWNLNDKSNGRVSLNLYGADQNWNNQ